MTLTNVPSLLEHHWKNVYFKHNRNITKITVMQINFLLFLLFVILNFFLVSTSFSINTRIVVGGTKVNREIHRREGNKQTTLNLASARVQNQSSE